MDEGVLQTHFEKLQSDPKYRKERKLYFRQHCSNFGMTILSGNEYAQFLFNIECFFGINLLEASRDTCFFFALEGEHPERVSYCVARELSRFAVRNRPSYYAWKYGMLRTFASVWHFFDHGSPDPTRLRLGAVKVGLHKIGQSMNASQARMVPFVHAWAVPWRGDAVWQRVRKVQ